MSPKGEVVRKVLIKTNQQFSTWLDSQTTLVALVSRYCGIFNFTLILFSFSFLVSFIHLFSLIFIYSHHPTMLLRKHVSISLTPRDGFLHLLILTACYVTPQLSQNLFFILFYLSFYLFIFYFTQLHHIVTVVSISLTYTHLPHTLFIPRTSTPMYRSLQLYSATLRRFHSHSQSNIQEFQEQFQESGVRS